MEFEHISDWQMPSLATKEIKDLLLQWNLDNCLTVKKFRFVGTLKTYSDFEQMSVNFLHDAGIRNLLELSGSLVLPIKIDIEELQTTVRSMDFFDVFTDEGLVSPSGSIRGCPDEIIDGISIGDKVRECLVNESAESFAIFDATARQETIFHIFTLFCVGGAMCQPDNHIDRYLSVTKAVYKDILTVYRDASDTIKVATKIFVVKNIEGVTLFAHPDNRHNELLLIIDSMKKHIIVIKKQFLSFW